MNVLGIPMGIPIINVSQFYINISVSRFYINTSVSQFYININVQFYIKSAPCAG